MGSGAWAQGLAFDLHVYHAYNPYQGLIKGMESVQATSGEALVGSAHP